MSTLECFEKTFLLFWKFDNTIFENMASRFQLISEEDLKKLSEIAENQNTKKVPMIGLKFINNGPTNGRSIQTWRR